MTDRELLELAAKAAGVEVRWRTDDIYRGSHERQVIPEPQEPFSKWLYWRPLEDDGDALRLASKLNLSICYTLGEINATWGTAMVGFSPWNSASPIAAVRYQNHEEKMAATRRAIVRAAAEIGRQMP